MAEKPTAEELLASVAERDEDAVGELYERFAPGLMGMLLRVLSDREAAEQLLQDVFLRLWSDARHYKQEQASVAAWLVIMARTAAIDRLRAERGLPTPARGRADPLQKSRDWLPRPEQVTLLDQRRELLKKFINQLPKTQRQALDLVFFEGYTESEIAQKLGEPLGKVKTSVRAALGFLRHRVRAVIGIWTANI